jgi:hypothetical protein
MVVLSYWIVILIHNDTFFNCLFTSRHIVVSCVDYGDVQVRYNTVDDSDKVSFHVQSVKHADEPEAVARIFVISEILHLEHLGMPVIIDIA